jgi:hypothetical protein
MGTATQKPIDTHRSHGRKSAGPTSPEGKTASRFNDLKTSIAARSCVISGEDSEQLDALAAGCHR